MSLARRQRPVTIQTSPDGPWRLIPPAGGLLAQPMPPDPGERWPARISALPRHNAGSPRYAQAREPHRRGALAAPVGTTREASIFTRSPAEPGLPVCAAADVSMIDVIAPDVPLCVYVANAADTPTMLRSRSPSTPPTPGGMGNGR